MPRKGLNDNLVAGVCIIIASLVIGICIIIGARMISDTMRRERIAFEKAVLFAPAKDMQAQPGEIKERNIKPGQKRVEGVGIGKNTVKGNPWAKVLIVEFSDFQCPFSGGFYRETFPQIEKEYIAAGKVKFAFRDFPLDFHPLAKPAAIACRCAGRQGQYWQMFEKIANSSQLDAGAFNIYAADIGLNTDIFNRCLDNQETLKDVQKDIKDGLRLGVTGTPTFFINGRLVSGAVPFEVFKTIIDEELTGKGSRQ